MPGAQLDRATLATKIASAKLRIETLSEKIARLKRTRSEDPLQQLQTEVIIDLYEAVKHIEQTLWPWLLLLPDTGAVKDAANAAQKNSASSKSAQFAGIQTRFRP